MLILFQWTPETQPPEKNKPGSRRVFSLLGRLDALSNKAHSEDPQERITLSDKTDQHPFPGQTLTESFLYIVHCIEQRLKILLTLIKKSRNLYIKNSAKYGGIVQSCQLVSFISCGSLNKTDQR